MTFNTDTLKKNIFLILYLLIIVSDFYMKLNNIYDFTLKSRYSGFIKLLFEFFLMYCLIKNGVQKRYIYLVLGLIICFLIGQCFFVTNSIFDGVFFNEVLSGDIYHLNKYLYIILFVSILKNMANKIDIASGIIKLLTLILLINSAFIILGFCFDINLFKSFPGSARFGYSGLFSKSGEGVLLYLLFSILFYTRYLKGSSIFPVVYFVLIALLSGKKIALLILPLFYIVHFCMYSNFRIIYRLLGVSIIVLIIFFKKLIIEFLLFHFPFWQKLFQDKGIWTVIFSTRNLNFQKTFTFIKEYWSPVNYFFGGIDYYSMRIELDPIDLFVFFGLIGGVSYLVFIKNEYYNSISNYTERLLLFGYILIGMIYGAFLFNILLMTILYISIVFCNSNTKLIGHGRQ